MAAEKKNTTPESGTKPVTLLSIKKSNVQHQLGVISHQIIDAKTQLAQMEKNRDALVSKLALIQDLEADGE